MFFIFKRIQWSWFSFKRGISNLFYWTPVIWKDVPFDYNMFYTMAYYKLLRLKPYICDTKGYCRHGKKEQRHLIEAIELAKRLEDDIFYFDMARKHWRVPDIEKIEDIWEFRDTDNKHLQEIVDIRPLDVQKRSSMSIKESRIHEKEDREYFFNLLNKYLHSWWD